MPHVFNAPGEGDRVGFSPYDRSLESKKLASWGYHIVKKVYDIQKICSA